MDKFNIPAGINIEYHFVKTVMDSGGRSVYRLKFLKDQIAKWSTEEKYSNIDTEWNVNASKKTRNDYPLGTIFKIKTCKLLSSSKGKIWAQTTDSNYFELSDEKEAEKYINKINKLILDKSVEPEEEPEEEKPEEHIEETSGSKKPATFIQTLLKKHRTPSIKKDKFWVDRNVWIDLIRHTARGKNILISGESGIGKTELPSLVAKSFGMELKTYDMAAAQDPIATLLGVHRIDEDGKSKFDVSDFINDISTPNFILLDELNRAPQHATNILFPLLDKRRTIKMSLASSSMKRDIPVHPDTVFFATANIGPQYTGTELIDKALEERFVIIDLQSPTPKFEKALLISKTGISMEIADKIVKITAAAREKFKNDTVSHNISVRQSLDIASMVADGYDLKNAITRFLTPHFKDEMTEIKDIIQSL